MTARPVVDLRVEAGAGGRISSRRIRRRASAVLEASSWTDGEVSLLLTTDETMRALNLEWRGEDRPTDVLSFPAWDGEPEREDDGEPCFLGDIAIDVEAAERQARTSAPQRLLRLGLEHLERWGVVEEITFLLIHGVLHLLGHDHADPEEEAAMVREEARLMQPFLRWPWARAPDA